MNVEERNSDVTTAPGDRRPGGPVTEETRLARARRTGGQPATTFESGTPYDLYVRTDVLHSLQHMLSDEPEERAFLVVSQIMELYFGLLRAEWELAQRHMRADEIREAVRVLRRSVREFEGLTESWRAIDWLSPAQFNRFRDQLGVASGFQSWAYRRLEFLLGVKQPRLLELYRGEPELYAEMTAAFHAPSLYDDAIAALARAGADIPDEVLRRDFAEDYRSRPEVEAAWLAILARERLDDPLWELAEALTDVSAAFRDWRYRHLNAVRRSMGAKVGSGGSSGLQWLEKSLAREVFPELWSARTAV